jgi:hypothetical protein
VSEKMKRASFFFLISNQIKTFNLKNEKERAI